MNLQQYLAQLLSEEANEAGQRASKLSRFGHDEVQPGQMLTNYERLVDELDDLDLIRALLMYSIAPGKNQLSLGGMWAMKMQKIIRYAKLSVEKGQLEQSVFSELLDLIPDA